MPRSGVARCDENDAEFVAVPVGLLSGRIEPRIDATAPKVLVDTDRPPERVGPRGNRLPRHFRGFGEVEHRANDTGEVGCGAGRRVRDDNETGYRLIGGRRDMHAR